MTAQAQPHMVPRSCGGPISDEDLQAFLDAARKLQNREPMTQAEMSVYVNFSAGIAEELQKMRQLQSLIHSVSSPNNNVVYLKVTDDADS